MPADLAASPAMRRWRDELELVDDVIAQIERRRIGVHDRLDRLAERRDAMSAGEREDHGNEIREEGTEIVDELMRLETAASLTCGFLSLRAEEMRGPP
ncbi:MAG: hypothetical protein QOD60_326 [Solirubrobacterales bacterium]|nr:hypothetical protein [Solirubrobacterales bacterium]